VLSLKPDRVSLDPLKLGVVGPHDACHEAAFGVRAFIGGGYEELVQHLLEVYAYAQVAKKCTYVSYLWPIN
jgi:hypothetical protein